MSRVYLAKADYDNLASRIEEIFKAFPLSLRNASVLVKPNMLSAAPPEQAVTTHPALVAAVVDYILASGGRPMVGDNPGARGYGINRLCGGVTGIAAASRGFFVNLGERAVEVPLGSPPTDKVRVSVQVMEADLVISLPKLKTHVMTVLTAGIKNTFGYVIGAEKSRLHAAARAARDFARILVDVHAVRPPDLTVIDAVTAMEGDGPGSGKPRRIGRLIASSHAVAADSVAARLVGLDPKDVPHLRQAMRRWPAEAEIGEIGPEAIEPLSDFDLPASFVRDGRSYLANWLFFSILRKSRLRVRREKCTGCCICRDGCPVGAIDLDRGCARLNREICVNCYCCHELCPQGAVELSPLFRHILHRKAREQA